MSRKSNRIPNKMMRLPFDVMIDMEPARCLPLKILEAVYDCEVVIVSAPITYAVKWPVTWLDPQERKRLSAYRFAADRMRHHAAHALKRWVLGQLVDQPPYRVAFTVDGHGKPHLMEQVLHFNLSHSGKWVAMVICQSGEVGIDVEQARSSMLNLPWPTISHPDDVAITDLQAWTLKEAVSKSCGEGLTLEFTRLRLKKETKTNFRCDDGCRHWYAWHGMLDCDTHMAVASILPWSRLRWLQLERLH